MTGKSPLRVLIVGKHASMRFGGEGTLPLIYFDRLRRRGIEAWMLVSQRTQWELRRILPAEDFRRIHFVPDTVLDRCVDKIMQYVPEKIADPVFDAPCYIMEQRLQRKMAIRLVNDLNLSVVHEASPISSKRPSAMYGLGVPVVVGPLCGGMLFPPAFSYLHGRMARTAEKFARGMTAPINWLMPGKLQAAAVLVANEQTRDALPRGVRGKIYQVVESGVDLDVWKPVAPCPPPSAANRPRTRFVFLGRLVPFKGPDLLLEAFVLAARREPAIELQILGDGVLKQKLQSQARELGISDRVEFTGWVSRAEGAERLRQADAMVLPSLRECEGTVILEAFAMGIPVITADWGGPGLYVNDETGIRIKPDSRNGFIEGLADAMVKMASDPGLRQRMSKACIERARSHYFDWESKVDRLIEIYYEAVRLDSAKMVTNEGRLEMAH